jgi:hypothetical protein
LDVATSCLVAKHQWMGKNTTPQAGAALKATHLDIIFCFSALLKMLALFLIFISLTLPGLRSPPL